MKQLTVSPYLQLILKYVQGKLDDLPSHALDDLDENHLQSILRELQLKYKALLELDKLAWSDVVPLSFEKIKASLQMMSPKSTVLTMCHEILLDNTISLVNSIVDTKIPGDFIETGAWRGGMTVLMRAILKEKGITNRKVWVADSFEGLPDIDPKEHLRDAIWHDILSQIDHLKAPRQLVEQGFAKVDLLDDQTVFLQGWFEDTLPNAPIDKIALLRMDGDWYGSTWDALTHLYPKLSVGGYIIIDDYGLPTGCQQAVDQYRTQSSIKTPMIKVGKQAVYWQKEPV